MEHWSYTDHLRQVNNFSPLLAWIYKTRSTRHTLLRLSFLNRERPDLGGDYKKTQRVLLEVRRTRPHIEEVVVVSKLYEEFHESRKN